ncbi:MAG: hypothetical protein JWO53_255 [Chlamydiia bacterium]|nr:hypothetical protein [Chlamydiia bacterium]
MSCITKVERAPFHIQQEMHKTKQYRSYLGRTLQVLQPNFFLQIDLNKLRSLAEIRQLDRDKQLRGNYTIEDFRRGLWVDNQSVEGPRVWMQYRPSSDGAIYEFIDPKAKILERCHYIFCRIVIQGKGARFRGFSGPSFPGKLAIQMIWNVMLLTNVRDIALQDVSTHLSCCKDEPSVSLHIFNIIKQQGMSWYVEHGATQKVSWDKVRSYLEVEEIDDKFAEALTNNDIGAPSVGYDSFASSYLNSLRSSLTKEDTYLQACEFLAKMTIEELCSSWCHHVQSLALQKSEINCSIRRCRKDIKKIAGRLKDQKSAAIILAKELADIEDKIQDMHSNPPTDYQGSLFVYRLKCFLFTKIREQDQEDSKRKLLEKEIKDLTSRIEKKVEQAKKLKEIIIGIKIGRYNLKNMAKSLSVVPSQPIGTLISVMKTSLYAKPDHSLRLNFHKCYHTILDMVVGSKHSFLPEYLSCRFQSDIVENTKKNLAFAFFVLDSFYKQKSRVPKIKGDIRGKLDDLFETDLKTVTDEVYEAFVTMIEGRPTSPVSIKLCSNSSHDARIRWARYNEEIEIVDNSVAQHALTYLSKLTIQELYKNSPPDLQRMLVKLLECIHVKMSDVNERLILIDIFKQLPSNLALEELLKEFMDNFMQYCSSCATSLFDSYKKDKNSENTYPMFMLAKYLCKNRELFSFQLDQA